MLPFVLCLCFYVVTLIARCAGTADPTSNTINSPNYPSPYGPNEECHWKLSGPSGRQIQLKFNDFQLGPSPDNLAIHDGHSKTSKVIKTLKGTSLPEDVVSTGNALFLVFTSDAEKNYHGFELEYFIHGKMIN